MSSPYNEKEFTKKLWKIELYKIQLEAPKPTPVIVQNYSETNSHYGYEFHGKMDHKTSEKLLSKEKDGTYLIRQSPGATDFVTLSVLYEGKVKHFKIYYNANWGHYLKEDFKRYDSVYDLVADGLVNFHMQKYAASTIQEIMQQSGSCYQQSPYMTLHRRKLKALSNNLKKNLKTNNDQTSDTSPPTTVKVSKNNSFSDENEPLMIHDKNHAFKIHTFKGLNWCEFCANFLWGFTAQGVKCEDCGFIAHNKCSELVPAKCVPDLKRIRGVFGTDLTTLIKAHNCTIPFVIKKCVEEIESRGMLQEGIYRISGFADEIEALKVALDKDGERTDMSEAAYSNVNVIAGTLKLYLRLLPIPLITFQAYPAFMEAARLPSATERILGTRNALTHLPVAHFNCLKFIIDHLHRVASYHAVNKMNENNIATVFAPTLIATPQQFTDLSQEIFMLSSLIHHYHKIFI